ncbi:hypothetical protein OJF2_75720 [Aquisphaera giovannonii]|uniref:PDZ domain-containing protein n=1 Tax=Aquisphaera giovannonii TaxID=406548 RepID=A0A5B9WEF8_9BACT|nr:PDZ domain-containing protein [Aquisphaera giovannonii]QEH38962.1 hypothetical protein OJF2_75720 [Aquisphaera giovannonii]
MSVRRVLMACGLVTIGCSFAGERVHAQTLADTPAGPSLAPSVRPGLVPPGTTHWLGLVDSRTVELRPAGPWSMPAVEVLGVWPGSPAAVAGIEAGDVILAADGRRTRTPDDLRRALAASDSLLELTIIDVRTGFSTPVSVRLVPAVPAPPVPWPQPGPWPQPAPTTVLGVLRKSPAGAKPAAGSRPPQSYQVLDVSGWTWTLDFQRRPDLKPIAERLIGRPVLATGHDRPRPGPGVPEARILVLTDLRPARGAGAMAEGRDGPRAGDR